MVMSFGAVASLASCGGKKGSANYTLSTYMSSNPKTWNVHAWETNDDSYIIAYTEMGFYDLGFNDDKSGYVFLNEMASGLPVDVTSELSPEEKTRYFGRSSINLPSGIAFDIPLNDKACWEDGTPIKADDYVESMKRLLNPEYVNHRADSWYKGNTVLANAEAYFKNGQTTIEPAYNFIKDDTNLNSTDPNFCPNDIWYINLGGAGPYAGSIFSDLTVGAFYTVLNNRSGKLSNAAEAAATRITDAVGEALIKIRRDGWLGQDKVSADWLKVETTKDLTTPNVSDVSEDNMYDYPIKEYDFDELDMLVDGDKIVAEATLKKEGKEIPATATQYTWENLKADVGLFVKTLGYPRGLASKTNSWRLPLFAEYDNQTGVTDFNTVGIEKINDYKLRLIMASDKPVSMTDLKFSLTGNWLVKTDLYDKLETNIAGTSLKATKYGTISPENYMAYGPYKLTGFQSNKMITIEKNDKWYGWKDGNHVGQYQMEKLVTEIIPNHTTAMQKFEKGEIDDIELTTSDMKTYGASSRLQFTPESYTQKMSFNVTRSQLLKRQKAAPEGHKGNKTILANEDFRKAISLGIDRVQYAAQCTAGSQAFYGLLNNLYISDVDYGEFYRGTQQARGVYDSIYSHLGGSTIDETGGPALDSKHVGYNSTLAAEYLARAIETENADVEAEGHFTKGDKVSIEILVYNSESETTIASYNFIKESLDSLANAVNDKAGSKVIEFDYYMTQNEDYYDEAKKGNYDVIYSTWGGAQMNPWGLMEVYCDPTFDSNCEYGMTGKVGSIYLTFDSDGDGQEESKSISDWYSLLNNLTEISEAEYDMEDPTEAAKFEKDRKARHNQKLTILAQLEAGYIKTWSTAPILARSSASLTSFKVTYGSDQYIPLMGYGGIRYMTFNFTDAEWAKAISSGEINADLYKQ